MTFVVFHYNFLFVLEFNFVFVFLQINNVFLNKILMHSLDGTIVIQ